MEGKAPFLSWLSWVDYIENGVISSLGDDIKRGYFKGGPVIRAAWFKTEAI